MTNESADRGTLLVVDGHSLAFRAFYALPVENFSTSSGQATNAVWGFATMLMQVIGAEHPTHLAVAFDVKGGTFRNELLPQYKGTRDAAPEELLTQLPLIQRMLTALGVTYIEKPGYEGDDVIGTLARMGDAAGFRTFVLSGDRDAFQLIDDNVTVLYPGHHFKDLKHMTAEAIEEKYHVSPRQYPDLAALRGETADNIPGVPGVGDGFAAKWINLYGSLDGVIEHAEDIGGKKGEALRANLDQVRLNRRVNALVTDLDLGVTVGDLTFGRPDANAVDALFRELEFGERTRTRVLKAFNNGEMPALDATAEQSADEDETVIEPELDGGVDSPEALSVWLDGHMAGLHEPAGADLAAEGDDATFTVPADARCAGSIAQAWTLAAIGSAKPGRETLDEVAVMAPDGHAIVAGRDLLTDHAFAKALFDFIDGHIGSAIVHGYKEHRHMLAAAGVADLPAPLFDTKLAGYLIHPDFHADTIEQAAEHFLDLQVEADEAEQGELDLGASGADQGDADGERDGRNAAITRALGLTRRLAAHLAPIIDQRSQYGLLTAIELPISQVLQRMESVGAAIDLGRLTGMRDTFAADALQAQEIAWNAAGRQVNLQSPKQLQQVLFEDMGLKPTKRTKSGSYTTNAATLQDLYAKSVNNDRANDFLGALLRHRETNKLKQIVTSLIDTVNPADQRIHTTFEQTVAATGRLSSVDPNLQNIPNRNAAGREIRSAFVPGEGFEALLSSDYSQVELRIMADLSGDEALIEAFKSGMDFHKYVASLVYQQPIGEITPDQRSHVKAMSYGLAYGLSTYGLAQQLKISPAAADVLKDKYFATFGKVHDYLESLVAQARRDGYTETMFGRRRYFPGLKSPNRNVRDAAERGALNAPIQGSAADIMKIAMIRADQALREAGVRSRIILQIHDELVVEVAHGEAEQVTELVRDAMEHAVTLAVPLDVSTGIGSDWQLAAH
ncbi:DNA polymerase I [Bifidobacterium vespertilionis]|uniref:DNA polymerase I n=1 Tax=Bifidobacterium vespertilionis TaxID=2562524 RepID=A0A5J5DXS6_9BIFI|nr:DNA polymerase I [Bifidobacterium vespertilionis]KAA8821623.1 DNA polymerase I [Bifidobacterium vespertilionis]KAA8824703.1 DNA polymerase I [Bifidobacterium vespertilionis]